MNPNLINLIKANVKIIQVITYESLRVHAIVVRAGMELNRVVYAWNRIDGLRKWNADSKNFESYDDNYLAPGEVLDFFLQEDEEIILLLEDFHPDLRDDKPGIIRTLRNFVLKHSKGKTLILSQPFHQIPRELEKEIHIIELPYPDFADIKAIYKKVCSEYGINDDIEPDNQLIEAALGLTIMEAERAFSLAYIEAGRLTSSEIPLIIREKENVIKKSGFLEYFHPTEKMNDVGGLANLKEWLKKRGNAFSKGAREFGLSYPRGILLLGIPGTGKSLIAKAIGNEWHFPLLRLDMGKIFGGIVGESESNIRQALKIAEAIAPSILWIDEIEKGMSGMASSGSTDGGTTARVMGTFLTWMQEKTKPVFIVATANDISLLPPELLRKGRVDEIFFVDLPTLKERMEIFKIHLRKKERRPHDFEIEKLAELSKGFSGAEIEEVINASLFHAFDQGRNLLQEDIENAISRTYPLSRTMHETIEKIRKWAKSRAVFASSEAPEDLGSGDKETPKLKQETYNNPFIN